MIQLQSVVNIYDNSGINQVRCISIKKGFVGKPGTFFTGTVVSLKYSIKCKFKKGSIVNCFYLFSKKLFQYGLSSVFVKHVIFNFAVIVVKSNNTFSIPFMKNLRNCIPFHSSCKSFVDLNVSKKIIVL